MVTLIEMLALQKAQSENRYDTSPSDLVWAKRNIDYFEEQRNALGLDIHDNDILFDDQYS